MTSGPKPRKSGVGGSPATVERFDLDRFLLSVTSYAAAITSKRPSDRGAITAIE